MKAISPAVFAAAALALLTLTATAAPWPYDEKADAEADVSHALAQAQADHRRVLLIFGANWCTDCRALDSALHGSSRALIEGQFEVVKIDVGNFNKNLALDGRFGHPIGNGIPAVVVVDAAGHVLYSSKGGELANARRMGDQGIYDFLAAKLAAAAPAS